MKGDSESKLNRIFSDIAEKTGIVVSLEQTDGTPFCFEFCGEKVTAYLCGAHDDTEKITTLVSYLVSVSDFRQLLPDKGEYLKSILLGEGNKEYAYKFLTKYNITDGACYAIEVSPERKCDEALSHIEEILTDSAALILKMDKTRIAVVKFRDEIQSPVELGRFITQSLYEELGIKSHVGIGCEEKSFTDISLSYQQAATALRMSGLFNAKGNVHTYREFLLIKMLEDIPVERVKEYLEDFKIENAGQVFSDEEMTGTAEEFLENSLNISETSRNLFMHRNTLMYLLDKIERLLGLNIRNFSDAVTYRIVSILYKFLNPTKRQ